MIGQPRAVLFDLDETLYAERRFALSGFAAVARATAADAGVTADRIFRILAGALRRGQRATAFQQLCASLGWPSSRIAALLGIYRSHAPSLRLPVPSRQALAALRAGWRLAIVTNGPIPIQTGKIGALGLARCVDTVVYAAAYGNGEGKPAPEAFVAAARLVGVAPERCVFVGDDPVRDIAGARRVGMKTIRIRRGCHAGERPGFAADDADAVTGSLLDVPRLAGVVLGETERPWA